MPELRLSRAVSCRRTCRTPSCITIPPPRATAPAARHCSSGTDCGVPAVQPRLVFAVVDALKGARWVLRERVVVAGRVEAALRLVEVLDRR